MPDIKEDMKIVGKDGASLGTIDRVEGDRVRLAKDGAEQHRYIEKAHLGAVEGNVVKLDLNASAIPKA